jgi:mannosyltransferase OCH1-like enzyme
MSNNKERTFFKRIFYLVILVLFVCVPLRAIAYLAREFILCTNRNDTPIASYTHKDIPKRIHQVFFKVSNSSIQEKFTKGPESCRRHNPSYLYTLWNKTMVDEFIEKNYPDVKQLYNSYDHWVKRVDAAKYLVLFHFGGWYIDMDLICKRR